MEMRFSQIAADWHGELSEYAPYPKAEDRGAYARLPEGLKREIIKEGEAYLGYEYPVIRATDFMRFKRSGDRVAFEDVYFARRHALCGLVMAECVEHEGRFWDDIINGIFAICEESAWQLPPHNSYIRNEPQYLLPDATRPILDLFACETGALLSCVYYLLKKELEEISPFITKRIRHELDIRIITPYLTEHFWWMGKEEEEMCNWTPWCTQNILLSAFLTPYAEDTRREIVQKAASSCDYFLKDYGDDGCCDEGAQYYRHAGLCLFGAMSILDQVTGNAFVSLFQWDKIKNIAAYIINVHVNDKYYFNFADCSPIAGRCTVREYLFGKSTGQLSLMQFAARDFQSGHGRLYTDDVNQMNLFYRLQTVFTYEEVIGFDTSTPIIYKDVFYPSVGLFIVRNKCFSLAVKAGDNNDSHNHNDTGSFTLYKNGMPIFADIGVESYTKKTFSSDRYEIWTMQSCYHNLPTINGLDEKDGVAFCATDVFTSLDEMTPSISMELATAYPLADSGVDEAAIRVSDNTANDNRISSRENAISYQRKITLDKAECKVKLCDTTNAHDVILNFITYEKPLVSADFMQIGSLATATYTGAHLLTVEVLPITDPRLQRAWDHDLYRIRLQLEEAKFQMVVQ